MRSIFRGSQALPAVAPLAFMLAFFPALAEAEEATLLDPLVVDRKSVV